MKSYPLLFSFTILLPVFGLSIYCFVMSKNTSMETNNLDRKNNEYVSCLLSSNNLLKMILRNVSDQIAKIDYIKSVFKDGYTNNNVTFDSREYARELMNITKNSDMLATVESEAIDIKDKSNHKNNFLAMVLFPFISILMITIITNIVLYSINPEMYEAIFIIFLLINSVICYAVLLASYKKYTKSYIDYVYSLSYSSKLQKNIELQSNNLKVFKDVLTDYLYMLDLYIPEKDNSLKKEIKNNTKVVKQYKKQIEEVSNILNSATHSTDLNDVLQKVLLTRVKNTDELGIKISATSEHPLFVDIDKSSLYFILLTLIDDVMKKSSEGAVIDFKAKRQKNIASVSIIADETKKVINSDIDDKDLIDSMNPEIILPSKEGIDMYMIKTILDRFGGELNQNTDKNKNVINLSLRLEEISNSAY